MASFEEVVTSTMSSKMDDSSEKIKIMKQCNATITDYLCSKSDMAISGINKQLMQILCDKDLNGFDPQNDVAAEFYFNLSKLMNGFDNSTGGLVWSTIAVLERACENSVARTFLIHTHGFVVVLSKILLNVVGSDQRIRILTLMQKITYGIKITWKEPQLENLIYGLIQWIQNGDEKIANLSLSVLVNICYNNLPTTCYLTRLVDAKELVKSLVKLTGKDSMKVYAWKMTMILESITREISEADLQQFVAVTFSNIQVSFRNNDIFSLRNCVDFFNDTRGQAKAQKTIAKYQNFSNEVENLLNLIVNINCNEDNAVATCVSICFEFIHSLLLIGIPELQHFHLQFVDLALNCVQHETAGMPALCLLRTIIEQCSMENSTSTTILERLSENSTFQLLGFNENVLENTPDRITSTIQIIISLLKHPSLTQRVLANVNVITMNKIFSPLLIDGNEDRHNISSAFLKHTNVYVNCLALAAMLADVGHQEWTLYLMGLLSKPSVQMLIAKALSTGSVALREQTMMLIQNRKCNFPISEVCQMLCKMGTTSVVYNTNQHATNMSSISLETPVTTVVHEERVDKLLNKYEKMAAQDQISDIVTSEMMELYEHKLALMSYTEQCSQQSIELASKQVASLNHKMALMRNELERLRGMLYSTQLRSENLADEKRKSSLELVELNEKLKEYCSKFQIEKEKRHKGDEKINDLTSNITELRKQIANCSEERQELEQEKKQLSKMVEKYEVMHKKDKQKFEESENTIQRLEKEKNNLCKELEGFIRNRNELEKSLIFKDEMITKLTNEVKEMEHQRDIITSLLSGAKKTI